ncbi:MAG: epoxyqueuosine reductase QueH [Spirochaetes bacterium]|nr:epoxyqueuosine reductase QueH [Spirochaetota bacterium]
MRESLLLHTCCAPCLSGVYPQVDGFSVSAFFYNPNISIKKEYDLRLDELCRYTQDEGIKLLTESGGIEEWFETVGPFHTFGEKSYRCELCFRIRLEKTFQVAKKENYNIVASTLSVSPHKSASLINTIGNELASLYGIAYLPSNFKKSGGFQLSLENSKKFGFYRQNYCGCIYSKKENELRIRQKAKADNKAESLKI